MNNNYCESCEISKQNHHSINTTIEEDRSVEYILYSTGCTKCDILKKKMIAKNMDFTISDDVSVILAAGFTSAPVLYITETGEYMDFATANKLVNSK